MKEVPMISYLSSIAVVREICVENALGVYSISTIVKWLESAYSVFGAIRAGSSSCNRFDVGASGRLREKSA
jgi:hypothetical protein